MTIQTFTLPDPGEGLTEAEILSWYVAVGDEVTVNQVFVEVETAKAAVELPSPFAGRVAELLAAPGQSIAVGTPIIRIETDPAGAARNSDDTAAVDPAAPIDGEAAGIGNAAAEVGPAAVAAADQADSGPGAKIGEPGADGRIATLVGYVAAPSGATRRPRRTTSAGTIAASAAAAEAAPPIAPRPTAAPAVGAVPPVPMPTPVSPPRPVPIPRRSPDPAPVPMPMPVPAPGGPEPTSVGAEREAPKAAPPVRKLARDLGVDLAVIRPARADGIITRAEVEHAAADRAPAGPDRATSDRDSASRPDRRIAVRGVRKIMAQAMTASAFSAPHVTVFLTVDVTPMMELRDQLKRLPAFAGIKLSPLVFAARAVCLAVPGTPEINSTWDGDRGEIVIKDDVHLGVAANTPRGLVVPVLRHADRMGVTELAAGLAELTETARAGRTAPADLTGSSISITNVGVFGIDTGTPIINPGESAILAVGAIRAAPWVVGGQLAVRQVCQLALSFDHRVLDGAQGSMFLAQVGALFAQPGLALAY